jgi:hypothetical protein
MANNHAVFELLEATMIDGIKSANNVAAIAKKQLPRTETSGHGNKDAKLDEISALEAREDRVSLNQKGIDSFTYAKPLGTEQRTEQVFLTLRKLVAKILQDQQTADQIDNGDMETLDINKLTPEKAKSLVANDGHWKPEQTAARITAFSITIAGNDPKKIDKMKENIEKGFQLAKETIGGELPDMFSETYTTVMQKINDWAQKSNNTAKSNI